VRTWGVPQVHTIQERYVLEEYGTDQRVIEERASEKREMINWVTETAESLRPIYLHQESPLKQQ
jgi:hypothetical protein